MSHLSDAFLSKSCHVMVSFHRNKTLTKMQVTVIKTPCPSKVIFWQKIASYFLSVSHPLHKHNTKVQDK